MTIVTPSKICLGGNIFGYSCDAKHADGIIKTAFDLGIRSIDTADVYSNGKSEEIIGNSIFGNREQWFIASKIGVDSSSNGDGVLQIDNIRKKLFDSLKRLKTTYLDLYQVHRFDNQAYIPEIIDLLNSFLEENIIRSYGVSNFTGNQVGLFLTLESKLEYHQLYYNFLKPKILESTFTVGLKHILYGVLGRGVLTNKYFNFKNDGYSRANLSQNIRKDLDHAFINKLIEFDLILKKFNTNLFEYSIYRAVNACQNGIVVIAFRTKNQIHQLNHLFSKEIPINLIEEYEKEIIKSSQHLNLGEPVVS